MANQDNQTSQQESSADTSVATSTQPEMVAVDMKFRYKKTDLGTQRPTVELKVPVPTFNGLIDIVQAGYAQGVYTEGENAGKPKSKAIELILDNMYDTIRSAVVSYLAENENAKGQADVDLSKFTWDAIANQSRADRRSNQIPQEQWDGFSADYIAVMPAAANKTAEQAGTAAGVFLKKLNPVRSDKKILGILKDQLAIYTTNSPKAEEFADILELLNTKLDAYLASNDLQQLVQNL